MQGKRLEKTINIDQNLTDLLKRALDLLLIGGMIHPIRGAGSILKSARGEAKHNRKGTWEHHRRPPNGPSAPKEVPRAPNEAPRGTQEPPKEPQ